MQESVKDIRFDFLHAKYRVTATLVSLILELKPKRSIMRICSVVVLLLAVSFAAASVRSENINDLRYPKPLNLTNTFPFKALRAILNITNVRKIKKAVS